MIYGIDYTKLSGNLLSRCGINWIYHKSENIRVANFHVINFRVKKIYLYKEYEHDMLC